MISVRGILVCSSKMPVVFRHRTFLYRLISFIIDMQLYLLCFLPLLAKICFQVVLNKFHFSWKLISPFSKFVLTVFWCSTSYTPIVVPWKMLQEIVKDAAPLWPCRYPICGSGLRRIEETWTFSDAFMSLTWCSTFVLTELKESGCSFCFTSLFWGIQLHRLLEWLFCVVHVSRRNFLGLHFYGNIRILILKLIWQWRDWLWVFLLDFSSFVTTCSLSSISNLHGMKPAGSAQTCFSLETSNLFHD